MAAARETTVVEIRPGEGGHDAELFAAEVADATTRWLARHHHDATSHVDDRRVVRITTTAPLRDVDAAVAGVHRIQRVPANGGGRRHTSTVAVTVVTADTTRHVHVPAGDVRVDTYRGSGAGGQHRNVTDSAVRLTHLPTGVVVTCEEERSQHRNLAVAWQRLERTLSEQAVGQAREERNVLRATQADGLGRDAERRFTHTAWRDTTTDARTGRSWRMRDWLKGRWN